MEYSLTIANFEDYSKKISKAIDKTFLMLYNINGSQIENF